MNYTQAKKHLAFRPLDEPGQYGVCGPCGWSPCTPEQNEFLVGCVDDHLPLAPIARRSPKRKEAGFLALRAFKVFIVEGVRK